MNTEKYLLIRRADQKNGQTERVRIVSRGSGPLMTTVIDPADVVRLLDHGIPFYAQIEENCDIVRVTKSEDNGIVAKTETGEDIILSMFPIDPGETAMQPLTRTEFLKWVREHYAVTLDQETQFATK